MCSRWRWRCRQLEIVREGGFLRRVDCVGFAAMSRRFVRGGSSARSRKRARWGAELPALACRRFDLPKTQSIRTPLRSLARPEIARNVLLVRALGGETDGLDDPPWAARARGGTGRRDQEGVVCRAVARGKKRPPFSPADSPTSQKQHFVFIYIAHSRFIKSARPACLALRLKLDQRPSHSTHRGTADAQLLKHPLMRVSTPCLGCVAA